MDWKKQPKDVVSMC